MQQVLNWDKPKKIMTEEFRRSYYSSDAEIHGTYAPNMSAEDVKSWKAKLKYAKSKEPNTNPQVEIRKDTMVFIVSLAGGYRYNGFAPDCRWSNTTDLNIHISSNSPIQLDWDSWNKMNQSLEEAIGKLAELRPDHVVLVPDLSIDQEKIANAVRWTEKNERSQTEWVGRITKPEGGEYQAELNRDGVVVVVSPKGGYHYKWYKPNDYSSDTSKYNLHIATNRPIQLDWEGWRMLKAVIEQAQQKIRELEIPIV